MGTKKPMGMHISAIRRFLREHPAVKAERLTTSQTSRRFVKNETYAMNKPYISIYEGEYDENGKALIAPATVFVSHAWRYEFVNTVVDVMEQHSLTEPDAYYWFDLFTNNQNNVGNKDFDWFSTTFRNSIRTIGQVLLVLSPWDDPLPVKRAWCLFEIASALDESDVNFLINLPKSEIKDMSTAVVADSDCLIKALSDIQAEKAEATSEEDKKLIFEVIDESEGGFFHVNEQVKKALREWYVRELRELVNMNSEDHSLLLSVTEITRDFGFLNDALNDGLACLKLAARNSLGDAYCRRVYHNLANIYSDTGELDKAIEYYSKSLVMTLRTHGDEHPDVAAAYSNIGVIYDDQGNLTKALEYHQKSLEIELNSLGQDHPNVATSYNNIASIYSKIGEYDKALKFHNQSLAIQQRSLGENHPDTASSYMTIADVYSEKEDYDIAIEYYQISLKIIRVTLGQDHPFVSDCNNNMGNAYNQNNKPDKALECYGVSLEIMLELYGEDHPDVADLFDNMAVAYKKKGEIETAIAYQERSIAIKANLA